MTRKRALLVALLVIVLGVVATLLMQFRCERTSNTMDAVRDPKDDAEPSSVHRKTSQEIPDSPADNDQEIAGPPRPTHYRLNGWVLMPDGAPVEGATVEVTKNDAHRLRGDVGYLGNWDLTIPAPLARTLSAEDGSFGVDIDSPGVFAVFAEKADLGKGATMNAHVPGGKPIRIVLRPERGIEGRVYDRATGEGIADASISAWIQSAAPGKSESLGRLRVRSAKDGSFRLPVYDLGTNLFIKTRVRATSYATLPGRDILVTDGVAEPERLDVGMDRARKLHLTLLPTEGGMPPTGVKVLLSARTYDFPYQFVTDENGEIVVPNFPNTDNARIVLRDPHWALDTTHHPEITRTVAFEGLPMDVPPTGDAHIEIPVVLAGHLRGRVLDVDSGQPVVGVEVEVGRSPEYADYGGAQPGPWSKISVTDKQGRFEVKGLWRTRAFVRVRRNDEWCNWPEGWNGERVGEGGFSWDRFRNPVDLATEREREVTIFARRSATLVGRVVDEKGRPVPGTSVREESDRRDMRQVSESTLIQEHAATTDEQGRFALKGLYPLPEFTLHVRHPDYPDLTVGPFHLRAGASTTTGDVVLRHSARVTIFASGPDGPVAGLELLLTPISPKGRRLIPKTVVTDEQGIVATTGIHEREVDCRFLTLPDGLVPRSLVNPIRLHLALDGSDRIVIQLVKVHRLEGTLLDSDGQPIPEGGFLAHRIDESANRKSHGRRPFFADGNGRFKWNVPEGSRWQIEYVMRYQVDASGHRREVRYAVKSGSPLEPDVPTTIVAGKRLPAPAK